MGTATDLGLGLLALVFTLSSTFFPAVSPEFFRTGLRRGGVLVAGVGAGLQEKVTEWPWLGGLGGCSGWACFSW